MLIYGLADPISLTTRYVGATKGEPEKRLYKHVSKRNDGTARGNWISQLYNRGLRPIIFVITEVADRDWIEAEEYWITTYRKMGCNLLNAGIGGSGFRGAKQTDAAKLKISLAKRGLAMPRAAKQKVSVASTGKFKADKEQRDQIVRMFEECGNRREIARRTGMDRDTIGRIIRADAVERGLPIPRGKSPKERARSIEYNHYRARQAELAAN